MIRIRGELPQLKRCCMCLPLRHGLIVWGYIRLVIGFFILLGFSKGFFEVLALSKQEEGYIAYVVLFGFFVLIGGTDIVLNVVFVYAGHTKDLKMLKAYYIYSFILWILMIIMGAFIIFFALQVMRHHEMDIFRVWLLLCDVTTVLAQILIQAYVLLLVRSEFKKLENNCEFRFENKTAELACKIQFEEDRIANDDKHSEDIITNTHSVANEDKAKIENGTRQYKGTN